MKRITKIIAIGIVLIFISCEDKQPSCNGEDVKEVLFSLLKKEIYKEYENGYFNQNWKYSDYKSYAKDNGLNVQNFIDEKRLELKEEAKEFAEKETKRTKMELNGTRIVNVQKDLKKCQCTSELIVDRETNSTINYSAQYTEDDNVYVELKY